MPDYSKATELATEVAEKATAKSNRAWVIQNLEIVEKGLSDKTYVEYVQMLNDDCGFDINVSVFANYLSDARKARTANPQTRKQTAKKISAQHDRVTPSQSSGEQETSADDWNEVEKKVGYRLSDEVRNYVSIKDGRIDTHFPKTGKMRPPEVRAELTRLRRNISRL